MCVLRGEGRQFGAVVPGSRGRITAEEIKEEPGLFLGAKLPRVRKVALAREEVDDVTAVEVEAVIGPRRRTIGPIIGSPGNPRGYHSSLGWVIVESGITIDLVLDDPLHGPRQVMLLRILHCPRRVGWDVGVVLGAEVNHFEVRIDLLQRTERFLPSSLLQSWKRRKAIVSTVVPSAERKRIKPGDLYLRRGNPLFGERLIGAPVVRIARVSRIPAGVPCVQNFA